MCIWVRDCWPRKAQAWPCSSITRIGIGSRVVTNASDGSSAGEQENLPFGTALGAGIAGNNRRFTSYDRSTTTKLDYAVNRTYNAGLGRFTQVDPIGMGAVSLANPQSLNLYAYCFNDPINHTDPDGLDGGVTVAIIVVQAVIGLLRAIFGGGKRARTAPIIKQITYRRQGQLTQRSIWTQAGVQAGVGGMVNYLQQRNSQNRRGQRGSSAEAKVDGTFTLRELFDLFLAFTAVANALKNPDCASILGGIDNAQRITNRVRFRDLNARNPQYNRVPQQVRGMSDSGLAGITPVGGNNVYLTDRFHSMITINAKAIVMMHELKHVKGFPAELNNRTYDYQGDYDEIADKCGFKRVVVSR